jgi:hypothetical protein
MRLAPEHKEINMEKLDRLVDRYIATWNERDAARRCDLIAAVWTEDATYVDPLMRGDGHGGINAMIDAVQARFPQHQFARTSEIDAHHERIRFHWALAPEGGAAIVKGVDFGVLCGDRLHQITGFIDQMPGSEQAPSSASARQ